GFSPEGWVGPGLRQAVRARLRFAAWSGSMTKAPEGWRSLRLGGGRSAPEDRASVLDCGSPLPLFRLGCPAVWCLAWLHDESARGLAQSTTWRRAERSRRATLRPRGIVARTD